jgi:hypothetical protein
MLTRLILAGTSIRQLFGHLCSGDVFEHDDYLGELASRRRDKQPEAHETPETQTTRSSAGDLREEPDLMLPSAPADAGDASNAGKEERAIQIDTTATPLPARAGRKRNFADYIGSAYRGGGRSVEDEVEDEEEEGDDSLLPESQESAASERALQIRRAAFEAAILNTTMDGQQYRPIGLISVTDNHSRPEAELGCGV